MATWEKKSYLRDIRSASRNKHDVLGAAKELETTFLLSVNLSISNMNLDLPEMLEHFWKILLLSNVDMGDMGKGGDVHHDSPRGTEQHRFNNVG